MKPVKQQTFEGSLSSLNTHSPETGRMGCGRGQLPFLGLGGLLIGEGGQYLLATDRRTQDTGWKWPEHMPPAETTLGHPPLGVLTPFPQGC